MNSLKTVCIAFLALWLWPLTARAYKRVEAPLSVAVLQADAIVVAQTIRVPEGAARATRQTAEIEITRSLKGKLPNGTLSVQLHEDHILALGELQPEKRYLFFLRATLDEPARYEVMLDGTQLYKDDEAQRIDSMVPLTPRWSEPQNGISTALLPVRYRVKSDEDLTLFFVCKNVSDQPIALKYQDWPLATHTYWELEIVHESGVGIPAVKHPHLTPEKINDYFSKHPRAYDVVLQPGHDFVFVIGRVNSAKPGWGYKEDLDFKFYPMTQPGRYEMKAKAHNLRAGSDIAAGGLHVWLE